MKTRTDNTQKCEFLLKLEDNIVCQRFFSVRNFNNKATNSLNLHHTVTSIVDEIIDELKLKTLFLLESNYKENAAELEQKEEYFTITIKKGKHSVYHRNFRADLYPPKVRYTVDIRPQISQILRELTYTLSTRKVITNYQDYSLLVSE
jgi:hypothetical protein|tara:strand:- start:1694 stop:2137 length:444 start_codon:yes stop_codon:yes gene_type:complete